MFQTDENLEKLFKTISYGVAVCGVLSLLSAGGIGVFVGSFFFLIIILAWFLENTKWQLTEKLGVLLIFLLVPLFYVDWKYQLSGFNSRDALAGGNLSRLILVLGSIKLLQKKNDRDWIFVYVISFFQILLAAGIGVSPLFLGSLILYLLFAFSSIILFEIRKTSRITLEKNNFEKLKNVETLVNVETSQLFRLPATALALLFLIAIFAVPLFFALPRVGGAGFGSNLNGLSGFTGFSDSVKLGEIGRLQQNNEVVMRVRVENNDNSRTRDLRWRGVALDNFENRTWRKSKVNFSEPFIKTESDYFLLDAATDANQLVTQTIYLEPIDTPVLFALSRPVAVQGNFQLLSKDAEGSITMPKNNWERISYKVFSDTAAPSENELKTDNLQYSPQTQRYLQLPKILDERVAKLTQEIIANADARNRYDQARAVENYLQTEFGYTLEMKAGGRDPLADFLFNIREGHCEYFASSMAIMLRTQGIATRVVNGFQSGEYNETADVFVVRQKDAHSWVEVYFPQEKVWIPFDPTPAAGQFSSENPAGITEQINKYVEALETFWIQYVVSYDNQEQRSLFRSIRNNLSEHQDTLSVWLSGFQKSLVEWWSEVRGEKGFAESLKAVALGIGYILAGVLGIFLLIWTFRKLRRLKILERFRAVIVREKENSVIEFYERMQKVLQKRGLKRESHQTPLEFAFALDMPEAVKITEKYNNVRFGEKNLSRDESAEIENWLKKLETKTDNE